MVEVAGQLSHTARSAVSNIAVQQRRCSDRHHANCAHTAGFSQLRQVTADMQSACRHSAVGKHTLRELHVPVLVNLYVHERLLYSDSVQLHV